MITFFNGHRFDLVVASGALGFDGKGWWWERWLYWLGLIDPHQFTIITKTVTLAPRKGNLSLWCPWRCVRLIPGGAVNAVSLTNEGFGHWKSVHYPTIVRDNYKAVISVAPANEEEAIRFGVLVSELHHLVGVEVNVSCPNVAHDRNAEHTVKVVKALRDNCSLPVVVKLSCQDDYLSICKELDGYVDALDLINTISWSSLYSAPSPLARYSLEGGVSGLPIARAATFALINVKKAGIKTPVISGGGVMDYEEVLHRFRLGADAVALGSIHLTRPWAPRQIAQKWRQYVHINGGTPCPLGYARPSAPGPDVTGSRAVH